MPPTAWRLARPSIEATLGLELVARGFSEPDVTMWRRRGDFVDIFHMRSKYGTCCCFYFGCDLHDPAAPHPSPWGCAFQSSIPELGIPADSSALADWVVRDVTRPVVDVVDSWFPRFTSIEHAVHLLKAGDRSVGAPKPESPAAEKALSRFTALLASRRLA
jgi:hypothetical protein